MGERQFAKLPPRHRLLASVRFFATPRSVETVLKLLAFEALTFDEQTTYQRVETEALGLRSLAARTCRRTNSLPPRFRHLIDFGLVTLVCPDLLRHQTVPLAKPSDLYTEPQAFADVDAMVELHGHI